MRPPVTSNWYSWMCSQYGYYFDWLDGTDGKHVTPPDFVKAMPKEDYCSEGYWKKVQANETWSVYGFDIDYCLSEKLSDQCSLNVTVSLLMVVIAFNFVKVVVISMTLFTVKDKPLITIGDAVASFIRERDTTTEGMCLLTKEDVIQRTRTQTKDSRGPFSLFKKRPASRGSFQLLSPKPFKPSNPRGFHAASRARWLTTSILTLTALLALLGLLTYALVTLQRDASLGNLPSIWSLGLHTTSPHTLITHWSLPLTGRTATTPAILISNTPQALLTLLTLHLNALLTALSAAREHAAHASRPRTLRVAGAPPTAAQRSTYFLQLPYRLGAPAAVLAVLAHWCLSQALFVAKVDGADARGRPRRDWAFSIMTCGYSPLALVLAAGVVAVGWAVVVALGARRVRAGGMPVAGCCSVVVAAACQGPEGTGEGRGLM
ncbi:uncharacterized protein LTHEOB_759 [Neofusicoccum parvum]|uniref:Uncharacterized protein LTHEOB_759 n=1 Tax=Neofusicoccum parvum TaxID=310453 RepID=A0ACB5S761_9PEZI|nr:uncharacterized protein LTHEOB_759 [Neofusicoccum parvum]